MSEKDYYLNFMFDKISVRNSVMVELLKSTEFVDEIKKKIDDNVTINNKLVYEIVKMIYFPKKLHRESTGKRMVEDKFNHQSARSALRQLGEKLYGDRDYWQTEYKQYSDCQ